MRSDENPSLRFASCCNVDVVNGAEGRCDAGFSSTDVTVHGMPRFSPSASDVAACSSSRVTVCEVSWPLSLKSLPVATRRSSTFTSVAPNSLAPLRSRASRSQKPALTNARRSSSRSTMRRTATLCTRPAERPVCTFFHSTGDSV